MSYIYILNPCHDPFKILKCMWMDEQDRMQVCVSLCVFLYDLFYCKSGAALKIYSCLLGVMATRICYHSQHKCSKDSLPGSGHHKATPFLAKGDHNG